jgi:3-methyl-2-oxobutanoate hydroxymethyltransferase
VKATTRSLRALKGRRPLVCLTAYDAVTARLADAAGVDLILVGDSLGNVVLGHPSTVPVTLDDMLRATAAVARAKPGALVVADIPFALAHDSFPTLLRACRRLLQESGAEAVKVEGGATLAPAVARLVDAGIPVMGHVGLLPQRVHAAGYRRRGVSEADREAVVADARALAEAGAFAIVAECVEPALARRLRREVPVPVVGIGSGKDCDGQILVFHDLLGLTENPPPFARREARLGDLAVAAIRRWAGKVRKGASR